MRLTDLAHCCSDSLTTVYTRIAWAFLKHTCPLPTPRNGVRKSDLQSRNLRLFHTVEGFGWTFQLRRLEVLPFWEVLWLDLACRKTGAVMQRVMEWGTAWLLGAKLVSPSNSKWKGKRPDGRWQWTCAAEVNKPQREKEQGLCTGQTGRGNWDDADVGAQARSMVLFLVEIRKPGKGWHVKCGFKQTESEMTIGELRWRWAPDNHKCPSRTWRSCWRLTVSIWSHLNWGDGVSGAFQFLVKTWEYKKDSQV